jgi:hypothetical protein
MQNNEMLPGVRPSHRIAIKNRSVDSGGLEPFPRLGIATSGIASTLLSCHPGASMSLDLRGGCCIVVSAN